MSDAPTIGAANGATFGTLAFFLLATLIYIVREHAQGRMSLAKMKENPAEFTDSYMSARNTQGTFSLTMSFFASGAGAWVLFTLPEAAILGGPLAILGYAISCAMPLLIFAWAAPVLRSSLPFGITFFEYVQARYGPVVNFYVTLVSLFYLFLYLAAEFSSVGSAFALFSSSPDGLPAIIGTSIVTLVYTTLGGLPVSLITDKVQGVGLLIFTVLVLIAVIGFGLFPEYTDIADSKTASDNWKIVTSWGISADPGQSVSMAIVLILAVTAANLMHSGFQQRIWAAQDNAAVRNGLFAASAIMIPFILLFGFFGMIAFARFGFGGLIAPTYLAFLGGFFIIQLCPTGWQILALILAVMMVASSADTIQTGMAGLLSPAIDKSLACCYKPPRKPPLALSMGINLCITIALNIVAIVLATQNLSVLFLFVLADLLCATCCVPVFMGLWDRIHPVSALAGCIMGLVTALAVYGAGLPNKCDASGVCEDGLFQQLIKPGGLYASTSLVAFIATPVASGLATLLVNIPFFAKGYKFAGYPEGAPPAAQPTAASDVTITSSA
jgi:Na+/proline symporter